MIDPAGKPGFPLVASWAAVMFIINVCMHYLP